jgi:hypothetical protein
VDLLSSNHRDGLRLVLQEVIERDDRVAVGFAPGFYKVFTFDGAHAVDLQDCIDRDDALRRLAV